MRRLLTVLVLGGLLAAVPALAAPAAPRALPWFGPEDVAGARQAAERGLAWDAAADGEVALPPPHVFLRPGALIASPGGCTAGFVFGEPGAYRLSTAAHCGALGDDVFVVAVAGTQVVAKVGTVTQLSYGLGRSDWALVDVDAAFQPFVDPDVAVVGGPEGGAFTGTASVTQPRLVKFFGNGGAQGPRLGLLVGKDAETGAWVVETEAVPVDSGAPVLLAEEPASRGRAVGLVSALHVCGTGACPSPARAYVSVPPITLVPATLADGDGGVLE